ncbi:Aliphatic amidase expression-regulating protein [Achromobacter xylosoxidans]|nr:Aliphatic amidase expression-regulating protein [Achromobacter xylosoxidans]
MIKQTMLAAGLAWTLGGVAHAAEPVKIGFIATLSTPAGYIGEDERDAFNLAIKQGGGKLGGVPVQLVIEDDGLKPANAKQAADRMLQSGIKLFTGVNFSNVLAAVAPGVVKSGAFYVSLNPGPSSFAGEKCDQNYFVASYQNDAFHTAGGVAANELGYKRVALLAPNYQAGRDAIEGFKRTYKGEVVAEIYTKLDQSDFSVELARVRSLAPDAVYQFHPGGTGINFVKQYAAAGLNKTVPMLMPSFSMDARMIKATGDAALGAYTTGIWSQDFDNPQSKAFVQALQGGLRPRAHRLCHAGLRHGATDRRGPEGHRRRPVAPGRVPRRAAQAGVCLAARQVQHEHQPASGAGPVPDAHRQGRRRRPVAAPGAQAGVR